MDKTQYPLSLRKMLYSIKNIEELETLTELVSLQHQVEETLLQDKLGK